MLWDAARKCIVISCTLASQQNIWGWRKGSDWKKRVKIEFRKLQKTRRSGGKHKEFRLKTAIENYLNLAQTLYKKINTFKSVFKVNTIHQYSLLPELEYCSKMPAKHIDLAERRLLKGKKIPYSEKVFSLFEPHTKCPDKGEENFEKYVALAVLSYNLHRLGNLIKKKSIKEKTKQRHKAA